MEAAIDAAVRRLAGTGDDALLATDVTARHPFDTTRRRESCIADGWLLVKGAPDCVLPGCAPAAGVTEAVEQLASRGLRILAVAGRPVRPGDDADDPTAADLDRIESGLEVFGLLALQDPPRDEVAGSLATCREAGIKVAMLTGDHPTTARAIAAQVGLLGPEGIVVEGRDLPEDDAALGELLDHDGVVISRVTPEDKLRITTALQHRGHVVAMTGDGVNDAPALREADIGVAMGRSGTDVAREAADLVLLDDDFATIVAADEQGRATFSNIRRFLTYHLTDNVAELTPFVIWALTAGSFPLALGVLQILCLDIGTDLLPALALGGEQANPQVMHRPPERRHLIDGALLRRVFGVLGPTEAAVEMAAFSVALAVASGWPSGPAPEGHALLAASGAAFAAVIFGQMATAFACRSATRPVHRVGLGGNRLLVGAVASSGLALAGFLLIPPVADVLEHAAPPAAGLAIALCAIPAVVAADAVHKALRARRRQATAVPSTSPMP
jgi:magnesium-transporting ATPase (P-type)